MKQLLVLSGKGGTGKTTVACALIKLSRCQAFADCDVDAPNLHLVLKQLSDPVRTDYYGFGKAVIDQTKCLQCGLCEQNCHFGAIRNGLTDFYKCEGCGLCTELCPVKAIKLVNYSSGDLILYQSAEKVFSTAQLKMGSGASGKLVTTVKKNLTQAAPETSLAIIDGSPGIGCPVIASISGVNLVLIVTEPTVSGIHDMKRIFDTARHFGVKYTACINKYDVNLSNTEEIEQFCGENGIPVVGKIPLDETVPHAVNHGKSIADYPESPAGKAVASIWKELKTYIK